MSEWWTYRLSDFLMFSPATYWRLVEQYNRDAWPLQWLTVGMGLALLWLCARRHPVASRVIAGTLAAAWLWVAWAFHWQRYAPINWAAHYLAWAFAVQAALLLLAALFWRRNVRETGSRTRAAGLSVAIVALAYPLTGWLVGRPWQAAEVFGLMPEPTAIATVGLLLASPQPARAWLLVIPCLSLTVGWLTLLAMAV